MTPYSGAALKDLLDCADYRSFIRQALHIRYPQRNGWGVYPLFAKAAGFSSRSTPRDVLSGRKRIVPGSFQKFASGLGLKGDLKEYFHLLVMSEETSLNSARWGNEKIGRRLAVLRERLLRRSIAVDPRHAEELISSRDQFVVFAALGSAESGAGFESVRERCKFTHERLQCALSMLMEAGMARAEGDHYYPITTHADFDAQGTKKSFENHYRDSLDETMRRLRKRPERIQCKDRLYFDSIFSIDPARAEEFRAQLRSICMQFIDKNESPNGMGMAKLLVAFEPFEN